MQYARFRSRRSPSASRSSSRARLSLKRSTPSSTSAACPGRTPASPSTSTVAARPRGSADSPRPAWRGPATGCRVSARWRRSATTASRSASTSAPRWRDRRHQAGNRAFTWRDGVFTYLRTLSDAVYSFAWSINDRGDIVGSSLSADGRQHWRDGTVIGLGSHRAASSPTRGASTTAAKWLGTLRSRMSATAPTSGRTAS